MFMHEGARLSCLPKGERELCYGRRVGARSSDTAMHLKPRYVSSQNTAELFTRYVNLTRWKNPRVVRRNVALRRALYCSRVNGQLILHLNYILPHLLRPGTERSEPWGSWPVLRFLALN